MQMVATIVRTILGHDFFLGVVDLAAGKSLSSAINADPGSRIFTFAQSKKTNEMPLNSYAQAKIEAKHQQRDHRFALKARLERARKQAGINSPTHPHKQNYSQTDDNKNERKHHSRKPDPYKNARGQALKAAEEREAAKKEKDRAARERAEAIQRAKEERERKKRIHLGRTKKGQPKLALQAESLLERIQKQQT